MSGKISNIQRFSIHDGPGIRTTVFFQGCPLKCWWCHNPECIDFRPESGKSRDYTADELLYEIEKDRIFYEESGGGVSFSGGEPMSQFGFLKEMLKACREKCIHTVVDTSGFAGKELFEEIMGITDLFLYDLKITDKDKHIKYTNVKNETILNNLKFLDKNGVNLKIGIPLIPEITDTESNISEIIEFLKNLQNPHKIDLLSYHKIAESKYERMQMEYKLKGIEQSREKVKNIRKLFVSSGFEVNT